MLEKWKLFLYSIPMERFIRTLVPAVVGVLVAIGVDLDSQEQVAFWTGGILLVWDAVVNFLETKVSSAFGWLNGMQRAYAEKKREALGYYDLKKKQLGDLVS